MKQNTKTAETRDGGEDWVYCPDCRSCGVGGCCPHYCDTCKDRHDGETQDGTPPRYCGPRPSEAKP